MWCSVTEDLEIVRGDLKDYDVLSRYHYRDSRLVAFDKIYALRSGRVGLRWKDKGTVGVIVYTMPMPGLELRGAATGGIFRGFDRVTRLSLINKNIRSIGRVIIAPRFRGLGLATRLVRETMAKMEFPIIESLAVMGHINPFFEKAGMKRYEGSEPARCVQMREAFSIAGIQADELIDAELVQKRIESLSGGRKEFVERQMAGFLQCYGKRRFDKGGLKRTRFILTKLTDRPVYYIWFNKDLELRVEG